MAEERDILTKDIKAAADIPASRLSEITRELAIESRASRGGASLSRFTVQDAVSIVLVRRMQTLGLPLAEAAKAVRVVTSKHLSHIILTDAPTWLVVGDGHAEVADAERVMAIAEGRGDGLEGLRLVRIDAVLRDVFAAKLQREKAMADEREAERVSEVRLPDPTSGSFLLRDLRLSIVRQGKGLAVRLDPEQARALARELWALAEEQEPEVKN